MTPSRGEPTSVQRERSAALIARGERLSAALVANHRARARIFQVPFVDRAGQSQRARWFVMSAADKRSPRAMRAADLSRCTDVGSPRDGVICSPRSFRTVPRHHVRAMLR